MDIEFESLNHVCMANRANHAAGALLGDGIGVLEKSSRKETINERNASENTTFYSIDHSIFPPHRRLIFLLSPFSSTPPNHCSISSMWKGSSDVALIAPHFSSKHLCRRRGKRENKNHICFVDRKAEKQKKSVQGHARISSPFAMLEIDQFIVAIRPSIQTRAPYEFIPHSIRIRIHSVLSADPKNGCRACW